MSYLAKGFICLFVMFTSSVIEHFFNIGLPEIAITLVGIPLVWYFMFMGARGEFKKYKKNKKHNGGQRKTK